MMLKFKDKTISKSLPKIDRTIKNLVSSIFKDEKFDRKKSFAVLSKKFNEA
jgi:hypothetical protein